MYVPYNKVESRRILQTEIFKIVNLFPCEISVYYYILLSMNDSEPDMEEYVPDVCHNLAVEEVYDLLVHASGKYKDK